MIQNVFIYRSDSTLLRCPLDLCQGAHLTVDVGVAKEKFLLVAKDSISQNLPQTVSLSMICFDDDRRCIFFQDHKLEYSSLKQIKAFTP